MTSPNERDDPWYAKVAFGVLLFGLAGSLIALYSGVSDSGSPVNPQARAASALWPMASSSAASAKLSDYQCAEAVKRRDVGKTLGRNR
jgi:hypothetical protein